MHVSFDEFQQSVVPQTQKVLFEAASAPAADLKQQILALERGR